MEVKSTNGLFNQPLLDTLQLSVVAHKLRGPNNAIIALLKLLVDEIGKTPFSLDDIERYVKEIEVAVGSSMDIIDMLDKFSLHLMNTKEIDINSLLGHFESISKADGILFNHVSKERKLKLYGDNNKIYNVIMELYNNSKKWFDSKKMQNIITIDVGEVENNGTNFIEIIYSDNGLGVAEENKLKIFESGECFGNNRGRGLGLSLVQAVIFMHGGTIKEDGIEKEGARFIILLPKNKTL